MQLNCYFRSASCTSGLTQKWMMVMTSREAGRHRTIGKFLLAMKLTAAILLITGLTVSAAGVSQRISFSGRNVSLQKILTVIEKQTGYVAMTSADLLASAKPVTIVAKDMSLEDFLTMALKDQDITFSFDERNIIFSRKAQAADLSPRLNLTPPPITVRGQILNEKGEPVVASVVIKGTKKGTNTDANGMFEISEVEENAILLVSGVSIETQEVRLNGRSVITITTVTKISAEDEIVINGGYYKTSAITKTGNIARVDGKDIQRQPVTSPLMALQGRAPGVDVTPGSGVPGSHTRIIIRGKNSLNAGSIYPLYVIDGVPVDSRPVQSFSSNIGGGYDPLSALNPADIESIEILKDADATAIYGSRGANGVVLISTKKSRKGKTAIDFTVYKGVGKIGKKVDLLNTQEYLAMRREAFANNNNEQMTVDNAYDLLVWDTTRYTDWQDVLIGGSAQTTDITAALSGGGDNTTFRFSANYHKQTTAFPGDDYYRRFSGTFSLNHISNNQKFRANISVTYGITQSYFFDEGNVIYNLLRLPPNAPKLYNDDGSLNWEIGPSGFSTWSNPLAALRKTNDEKSGNLILNSEMFYKITSGLTAKVNLGYVDFNASEILKTPLSASDPLLAIYYTPESRWNTTHRGSWIIEPQLLYNKKIGDNNFNFLIGSTFQHGTSDDKGIFAVGFASDALLNSFRSASDFFMDKDDNTQYRYTSALVRLGYDFRTKYLLNVTARRDGSSRFGTNNRFGNFGAVGAAWIFSKEKLIENNFSFISLGKVRGSIGTTGNDQVGDYSYLNTYEASSGRYQSLIGLTPSRLYNPNYQWEVTKKMELALELGLFANKARMELSWFRNRSSNLLVNYELPASAGFQSISQNLDATVENRGLEYSVSVQLFNKKNFQWLTSLNFTKPRNELFRFDDLENSTYSNQYIIGEPLDVQRFYKFTGVDPQTGLNMFLDVDNNGSLGIADRTVIRNMSKIFYGGFKNDLTFKQFQLGFFFYFAKQNNIGVTSSDLPGTIINVPQNIYDTRWRKPGDVAGSQKASTDPSLWSQNYQRTISDAAVEDASFARLQTLSLTYSAKPEFIKKFNLTQCRIFIEGQNIFTLTNSSLIDPMLGMGTIPPITILTLGLQIGF